VKKSSIITLAALLALTAALAGCGGTKPSATPEATAAPIVFKLAETHPADYPTTMGDKKFAELVGERSKGRIKIEVYPNSQLGEEKAAIEQVQLGAIAFTRVSSSPLGEFNKAMGVFALPYIFDNDDHMWKFLNSADGNKLLDGMQSSRMVGLAYYSSGSRFFYANKPLKSIDDIKGLKIRVQQNKINMDMIDALGASATPMPYGQVFSALQTGVIDAAENNYPSYLTSNQYQAAKFAILDGHQRVPEVLLMSKVAWDKLSDADKKLIKDAAQDSVKTQRELWAAAEKDSEAKLVAAGVTITPVTDMKPWQAAVKPVIDKYIPDFKDVLEQINNARK